MQPGNNISRDDDANATYISSRAINNQIKLLLSIAIHCQKTQRTVIANSNSHSYLGRHNIWNPNILPLATFLICFTAGWTHWCHGCHFIIWFWLGVWIGDISRPMTASLIWNFAVWYMMNEWMDGWMDMAVVCSLVKTQWWMKMRLLFILAMYQEFNAVRSLLAIYCWIWMLMLAWLWFWLFERGRTMTNKINGWTKI